MPRRYVRGVSNWNFNLEDLKAEALSDAKRESPREGAAGADAAGRVTQKGRFEMSDSDSSETVREGESLCGPCSCRRLQNTRIRKGRFTVEEVGSGAPETGGEEAAEELADLSLAK